MRILRGAMHVGTDLSSYCVWMFALPAVHRVLLSQEHLYGCETKLNVLTKIIRSLAIVLQCAC
jgi:hypothetical protein